ncbi:cytochrome P450 [Streptomyces sp. NPDC088551]|uniref:cytochrome P450 n=1 Tax=Streptomyces sp. NPDC088551 TaxID=3365863 RepID=UPI0038264E89
MDLKEMWPGLDGIPHPAGRRPDTLDMENSDFVRPMQRMYQWSRELGPIFETQAPGFGMVVVTGADIAKDLFDDTRFEKFTGFGIEAFRPVTGDGLFTAYNDEENWALAHRILLPAFSREALQRYHHEMAGSVARLVEHWTRTADDERVDLAESATTLALDMIGQAGFGFDFGSYEGGGQNHPYVSSMVNALAYSVLPPQVQQQREEQFRAWIETMNKTVDDVIDTRRRSAETTHSDILGTMMHARDEVTGKQLSSENMRYQVTTFMVAGYGTTASLITFCLYFLSRDPSLLATVRAEIGATVGDSRIGFESVHRLRILRRAVDETLRLWAPTPAFLRVATEDTVIGGQHEVKAGGWAAVLTMGLHRDAAWGGDVDAFDPDRFRAERVRAREPHLYKPFGTGPRACIGRQFALHAACLALAEIVRSFDVEVPEAYELSVAEGGFFMPENLKVSIRPRA